MTGEDIKLPNDMIRVRLTDGTEETYRARAAVITLDESGVPKSVGLENGADHWEGDADEIAALYGEPEDVVFRLQIERPLTQVGKLVLSVNSVHLYFKQRRIVALADRKAMHVHTW